MGSEVRKGETVSIPCRGCGRTFHRVKVAEGAQPLKCAACGRITKVRVRCSADVCKVFTEPARTPGSG